MSGGFNLGFNGGFQGGAQAGTIVHLLFPRGVDDHPRPPHPLWRRFRYPESQLALLLYRTGVVIEVSNIETIEAVQADDVIAGGHEWYGAIDSWQAQVLAYNNYPLEVVV